MNISEAVKHSKVNFAEDLLVALPYGQYKLDHLQAIYADTLHRRYPDLKVILDLFKGEIYVAGGCLFRSLFNQLNDQSDCDLFFVNCTKERIDQILRAVYNYLRGKRGKKSVFGVRNQNTTTFIIFEDEGSDRRAIGQGLKYQFVHGRSYPSKEAIVIGFDLGTSALVLDQDVIYGTPLAIFSVWTRCNILDPSRRSTSYEARINKYGRLGVGLITLSVNPQELNVHYGVHRKYRLVRHEIVKGISVSITHGNIRLEPEHKQKANQQESSDYGVISTCLYWMDISNARLAFKGRLEQMMWSGQNELEIFDSPQINWSIGKAFPYAKAGKRSATYQLLTSWFGRSVIDNLLLDHYPDSIPSHWIPSEVYDHLHSDLYNKICEKATEAQQLANKGVSYIGPNDNPGRQYTSSFNPVYSDVRDYYKKHAKITRIGIPNEIYFILKSALKEVIGGYWKIPCQLIMIALCDLMCVDILQVLLVR